MLFGGKIECKGHGFGFQDVISIASCPALFLLLNLLVTITCLMSVCAVMGKFLLIFFELQFEAEVGTDTGPNIFDKLECM
jgi:hypothetical protein